MFDLDNWLEIYETLRRNKLRTLLTAFGVFWGIFMLVLMLGSGRGLENGVDAGFANGATNSFFLWTRRTSMPYRGLPPGRNFDMQNGDLEAIHAKLPEARIVAPRNQLGGFGGGNNVTRGAKSGGFSVMGDTPDILAVQAVKILDGRFLNQLDLEQRRKVAVIGTRVRDVLFEPGEEPVGQSIEVQGVYFKVVGVFDSFQSGQRADRDVQTIYIPFTTFQAAFNYGDRIGWLAVVSKPGIPASEVETRVRTLLSARHQVAPQDERAFGSFNLEEEYDKIQGLFTGIRLLVWIVGIGTLAAGVIGVGNILLITVKERTKELGLRRAVGATPFDLVAQLLLEATVLTSIAGYFGLVAGVALLELADVAVSKAQLTAFVNPGVRFDSALQALGILVLSGLLAGLIPAQRAVTISPVEALRAE
ncbi:MAG: ABC transporter permease [Acidobacteria bacterium]|nr:ABC transporter permease [Acidobacteriota bacterium]